MGAAMSDTSRESITPSKADPNSLEERKFQLEQQKFDFEKSKSQGLFGFLNSNLAVIITFIIGVATVVASNNQIRVTEESNKEQRELQARLSAEQLKLQSEISANQLKLQSATSEAQRNLETL